MPQLKRLAILDDYQDVTRDLGPWDRLPHVDMVVFRDTLAAVRKLVELRTDPGALARRPWRYLGVPLTALRMRPR